jgi:outer membrane immunogenic protein
MYLGINGGWNLGSFNPFCRTCGPTATAVDLSDNSPFVGGHIGYLAQAGNFVVGPELGVQWWGFKSQKDVTIPVIAPTPVTLQQKIDWLAYANVRAGLVIGSSVLAYVTGGAAWAHAQSEVLNLQTIFDTANTQSMLGWDIGAGIEFKITENLIFGGEYRHYDFGKVSAGNPLFTTGITTDKLTVDQAMGRLTFRLN